MDKEKCPCCSDLLYSECCEPLIKKISLPKTAEKLMRSRYSAYAKTEIEYLINTTHESKRGLYNAKTMTEWSVNAQWLKLEIISTKDGLIHDNLGQVEFIAHYRQNGIQEFLHELSYFKKENDQWFYVNGINPVKKIIPKTKVGRNDPCPCGRGKKYKKCCEK
ncbi:MAG: YchJ family protein [Cyanobacteriota bacterium]